VTLITIPLVFSSMFSFNRVDEALKILKINQL